MVDARATNGKNSDAVGREAAKGVSENGGGWQNSGVMDSVSVADNARCARPSQSDITALRAAHGFLCVAISGASRKHINKAWQTAAKDSGAFGAYRGSVLPASEDGEDERRCIAKIGTASVSDAGAKKISMKNNQPKKRHQRQ